MNRVASMYYPQMTSVVNVEENITVCNINSNRGKLRSCSIERLVQGNGQ